MERYDSYLSKVLKPAGIGLLVFGIYQKNVPATITGSTLFIAGYLKDILSYSRGYFNERLQIEIERDKERKLKESKLEK